jgi:hypothetical protein
MQDQMIQGVRTEREGICTPPWPVATASTPKERIAQFANPFCFPFDIHNRPRVSSAAISGWINRGVDGLSVPSVILVAASLEV